MQVQALRQQNYQLKNQITDLKNAFDLNRDILKIVSNYNHKTDPQLTLLMQIITRLTTVNNQAMLNSLEHIHQKNILKQENLKLNLQINRLQNKLQQQIQNNRVNNVPNESKVVMQEQFNALSKELMAANQERIVQEHEIEHWKDKVIELRKVIGETTETMHTKTAQNDTEDNQTENIKEKIKRRYTSNNAFKYQILNRDLQLQNRKLKQYIQQLQNRLLIFIKAHNLQEDAIDNYHLNRNCQPKDPTFQQEREEIRLLKYALNDIQVERKEDQYILTITQRFREKDTMNNEYVSNKNRRSISWPKNAKEDHIVDASPRKDLRNTQIRERGRMEQRQERYY